MAYTNYIGIDIASRSFEVAVYDNQGTSGFNNNQAGFDRFWTAYRDLLADGLVVVEATGGYENALVSFLVVRGIAVHRASTQKASLFIRSLSLRAKTDRIDARHLARFAAERHPQLVLVELVDADHRRLQQLHMRMDDLKGIRLQETQRSKHPNYAELQDAIASVLQVVEAQIEQLSEQMAAIIKANSMLEKTFRIMTNFSGVGTQTALCLMACMPELGTLSRKGAASLAGVAPHPRQSGRHEGYRSTRGGRVRVRKALFMAVLSAKRYNPGLRDFYQRLIKSGKKKMVAIVATMRKMIVILNAMIRDELYQKTW